MKPPTPLKGGYYGAQAVQNACGRRGAVGVSYLLPTVRPWEET
jgi:hypothetical protein